MKPLGPSGEILVSGATGLIGARLVSRLREQGASVRALTRRPERAAGASRLRWLGWDGRSARPEHLAGCTAVVHLAGEPVFAGRLSAERRRRIRSSRIDSTRSLVSALASLPEAERPRALLCASAVGVYGSRGDEELDEHAAPGRGFLADVCRDWESSALSAEERGVRVVTLRIGIVLAREGGALPRMTLPFRLGLGGRIGTGQQWFPWIHRDDVVALSLAALSDDRWKGAVNATAPAPVRNAELTRVLGRVLGRPTLLPVPAFAVRLALGDLATELLGSRRAVPRRALGLGFTFGYPSLESALEAELSR